LMTAAKARFRPGQIDTHSKWRMLGSAGLDAI
jgi:hypothetical protein